MPFGYLRFATGRAGRVGGLPPGYPWSTQVGYPWSTFGVPLEYPSGVREIFAPYLVVRFEWSQPHAFEPSPDVALDGTSAVAVQMLEG